MLKTISTGEQNVYQLEVDGKIKSPILYKVPFNCEPLTGEEKNKYHILEQIDPSTNIPYMVLVDNNGNVVITAESRYHHIIRIGTDVELFTINGYYYLPEINTTFGKGKVIHSRDHLIMKIDVIDSYNKKGVYVIDKETLSYTFEHESNEFCDFEFTRNIE